MIGTNNWMLLRATHPLVASVLLAAALAAAPPASADEHAAKGVTIVRPWARATPGGVTVGAAYLEIRAGEGGDKLVGISSPAAGSVELHTSTDENGIMRMRRLDAIEIKSGATRLFAPSGDHIMLLGLKEPLKEGGRLPLTLSFEKSGEIEVEAAVAGIGAMGPPDGRPGGQPETPSPAPGSRR